MFDSDFIDIVSISIFYGLLFYFTGWSLGKVLELFMHIVLGR